MKLLTQVKKDFQWTLPCIILILLEVGLIIFISVNHLQLLLFFLSLLFFSFLFLFPAFLPSFLLSDPIIIAVHAYKSQMKKLHSRKKP